MTDAVRNIRLGRFKMLLVAAVFVLPFVVAWVAFHAGWRPGTRSHGQPILPQRNLTGVRVVMDNGSNWLWRDPVKPKLTLVALSDGACADACIKTLVLLRNARITLGPNEGKLRLLYLGRMPTGVPGQALAKAWRHGRDVDAQLAAFRPTRPGQVAAMLVEANGTALVRYPAGFSPDGLKDDLHKVIR